MNDNFAIDQLIEDIASKSKIKSFYPISISKALNLPINKVINRLNYLADGGLITLKYEVRCIEDLTQLDLVDSYEEILGKNINCYMCNEDKLITIDNIFIVYYINDDYIKSVKKKIQRIKVSEKDVQLDNNPCNLPSLIEEIVTNNEKNFFYNIGSIDSNLSIIAEKLANSGDDDIKVKFKEIDEEIGEDKKRKSLTKVLKTTSEKAGKIKDEVEKVKFYLPIIQSTIQFAISKWPEIEIYLKGLF